MADEMVTKFMPMLPEGKTEDDLRGLIADAGGDESKVESVVQKWVAEAGDDGKPEKPKDGANGDKEMLDFRHLMVKGLELKKYKGPNQLPEKCVIYMDVTCRTFFCAKQKNSPSAKAYPIDMIHEANASLMDKIISIVHREGQLDLEVSSPKVRDYLVRMLNKLFGMQRKDGGKGPVKKNKVARPGSTRDSGKGPIVGIGGKGGLISQVRLLAQHCYTLPDETIEALVTAKIPTHSRWESYQEFKDKINRRDELIRSLQDGLGTINAERVRFQRACEDIETHHQDELTELKQHLAMALTSFQELQRASEHRESEMRDALRGAVDRSSKFEEEKKQLLEAMNDQKNNAANASKEVDMLKEAVITQNAELDKKTAEFEDARKRFSQVKEALTVERNLRARAEIKEEQMRQETIQMTAQMKQNREKMRAVVKKSSNVEDRTGELEEQLKELEESTKTLKENNATEKQKNTIITGEVIGLKEALDSKTGEAAKLQILADKANQVDGIKEDVASLKSRKSRHAADSSVKIAELQAIVDEKNVKIAELDAIHREQNQKIQEMRGNIRFFLRVRPFLQTDGVDVESKNESITKFQKDGTEVELSADGKETQTFPIDKGFTGAKEQGDVYKEVQDLVASACDGYNVCLMAYGETGAGKTHTMQGQGNDEMRGIIKRAIEQISGFCESQGTVGWAYTVNVTFVDLYNEKFTDLLRDEETPETEMSIVGGGAKIEGASVVTLDPTNAKQIEDLMDTAAVHRALGKAEGDEGVLQAVQTHAIFQVSIDAFNEAEGKRSKGNLIICDPGGSERVGKDGGEADKSMETLFECFTGLANRTAYIPFKQSMLTQYLAPCMTGDYMMTLFVNIAPTEEKFDAAIASVRFGAAANKIELGKPVQNLTEMGAKEKEKRKKAAAGGGDGGGGKASRSKTLR